MKKKPFIILLVCVLYLLVPAYSSNIYHPTDSMDQSVSYTKLRGKVMDKDGNPIGSAIITELVDVHSNNMVQSDSMGYFEISLGKDFTSLMVSALGYLPKKLELGEIQGKNNLAINLDINPDFTIEEFEVLAKRKTVTITPTGLTYSMKDNPLKNNDAFEALKFIPMVTVQDNIISVIGKNVPVVYVNDRQLNLSGESLIAYLKALPAKI